jgi:hypothetical protein
VEATRVLPDGHTARVLEPSPPADTDPAWFADDPTRPDGTDGIVVSPTSDGDVTWDEMTQRLPDLADFAADRWLGALRRLEPLPAGFDETRRSLHRLAYFVLAPTRHRATGKLGLRWVKDGFGTPYFGADEQVRLEGNRLVHQRSGTVRAEEISSVIGAARFLDLEYREVWFADFRDLLPGSDPEEPLVVDPVATAALAEWFGFATSVLEEMRRTPGAVDVGRVQLWPEHFDPAVEMGTGAGRASFGASPGDDQHDEPYLYVAPWSADRAGDAFWNDAAFGGASLSYAGLLTETDQRGAALAFLRRGVEVLAG